MTEELEKIERERKAKEEMERTLGKTPSGDAPKFPLWKQLTDQFTDKKTQKADWAKIALAAAGGLVGGVLAIDAGIVGMAIAATLGTALAGTASVFLFDWLRKDDPNKKAIPPVLLSPHAPDPNQQVLGKSQVLLPGIKTMKLEQAIVDIPTYDVSKNAASPATRTQIEAWKKIVKTGHPDSRVSEDATNWLSRAMIKQLESKANQNEINLRYLRDTLPDSLKGPSDIAQSYLKNLGPDAESALSVQLDPMLRKQNITLDKIPGQYGKLNNELEEYGSEIKTRLADDLAKLRGSSVTALDLESDKVMINTSWDKMNVIAKRNMISNFAAQAIQETLATEADLRSFFPENETNILDLNIVQSKEFKEKLNEYAKMKVEEDKAIYVSFSGLLRSVPGVKTVTGMNEQEKFVEAYKTNDLKEMAASLKRRLLKDDEDKAAGETSGVLKDTARRKIQIFLMGFKAHDKNLVLDKYIQEELIAKEIPALEKFENALIEHEWHVSRVKKRMTAYSQGGSKFLVLDESKNEGVVRTFKVLDTRTDKPQKIDIEVTYEDTPANTNDPRAIKSVTVNGVDKTKELKGQLVPAGDIDRFSKLQALLETKDVLTAPSGPASEVVTMPKPDLRALLESERGKAPVTYSSAPEDSTPAAPQIWKLPAMPEMPGSDKERK